jgi:hypothetical protein
VEFNVGLGLGLFAEPVDPDRPQAERGRRRDVVEKARGDVHVTAAIGSAPCEELFPVGGRRLVRADLGGDDGQVEADSDPRQRGVEEVGVGVGEDGKPPAAGAGPLERGRHFRERLPFGQRAAERVLLVRRRAEPGERDGHHLAVAPARLLPLDLRLELVVRVQELAAARGAEQALQLAPDAAVPVDQRAVAVEGRPALP